LKVLGFGAVLWDDISDGHSQKGAQNIGGAVFNVMFHLKQLGHRASMLTAVGNDPLGDRTIRTMKALGMDVKLVKRVPEPTCLVRVTFDSNRQPSYSCDEQVSWDFITAGRQDIELINKNKYDILCFGTIEQRHGVSRETLRKVLEKCRFNTLYLDLTLRSPFYSKEVVEYSLKKCTVAKMNMEEAAVTDKMFSIGAVSVKEFMASLQQLFSIGKVVVTDGENGAYFAADEGCGHVGGYHADMIDPVGAGDAFSAGLLHKLYEGFSTEDACDFACRMGAMICSKKSSIADYTMEEVNSLSKRPDSGKTCSSRKLA